MRWLIFPIETLCTRRWKVASATVDTNVLVYAADVDRNFMSPVEIGWNASAPDRMRGTRPRGILYEFLRVTTLFLKSDAAAVDRTSVGNLWRRSSLLRVSLSFVPTERHADVAEEVILELPHLSPATCCTMRIPQFSCASTALGGSALGIPISINSSFWKLSIRFDLVINVTDTAKLSALAVRTDHSD